MTAHPLPKRVCSHPRFPKLSAGPSIVGYQTKDTIPGFNFLAPTFTPVDGSGNVNLQDIKLNSATAESWTDNLQILDEGGATTEMFIYATAEESGLEADGWLNGDGELATVTIPYGAGILADTANETSITFSGAVATEDSVITAVAGFNFTGNNTPVGINIQDIKLDATTAESWTDNLQLLDEGGATIEMFIYATAEESGLEVDGWLNGDGELADVTIEAGQGVLIDVANDGTEITIPSAM